MDCDCGYQLSVPVMPYKFDCGGHQFGSRIMCVLGFTLSYSSAIWILSVVVISLGPSVAIWIVSVVV